MAEISNNLIAGLLIVAIVISGLGMLAFVNIPPITLTGAATETGYANLSISGLVSITMVRNASDFGNGTLAGADQLIHTQQDNAPTTFDDGSEGNDTHYGSCASPSDEDNCVYPFVVENSGNVNVSINLSADNEASTWIKSGAAAQFKGKNNVSDACGASFGPGFGEGSWTDLNTTETVACSDLRFEESPTRYDQIRIHFRLGVPSDTTGSRTSTITIGAVDAS